MSAMKRFKYTLLLLLGSMIWGCAFVFQSKAMTLGMGPYAYTAVRMLLGSATLLPFVLLRKKTALPQTPGDWKALLLGGGAIGVTVTLASCLQQVGIQYTTAGKAAFLTALYILLVPAVGVFFKRKTPLATWLCLLLGAVGMYFLTISDSFSLQKGDLLVILCAVAFTLQILLVDKYATRFDPVTLCCYEFLVAGLLSMIPMAVFEGFSFANIGPAWYCILYGGMLSCGFAYCLQIIGQRHLPPALASLVMSFESVFGALFGALLLNERMSGRELFGCALIFIALLLSQLPQKKKTPAKIAE